MSDSDLQQNEETDVKSKEQAIEILKDLPPLVLMAIVIGFNELARNAAKTGTLGDVVYFREMRHLYHEALKSHQKAEDYSITFLDPVDKSENDK